MKTQPLRAVRADRGVEPERGVHVGQGQAERRQARGQWRWARRKLAVERPDAPGSGHSLQHRPEAPAETREGSGDVSPWARFTSLTMVFFPDHQKFHLGGLGPTAPLPGALTRRRLFQRPDHPGQDVRPAAWLLGQGVEDRAQSAPASAGEPAT